MEGVGATSGGRSELGLGLRSGRRWNRGGGGGGGRVWLRLEEGWRKGGEGRGGGVGGLDGAGAGDEARVCGRVCGVIWLLKVGV